MTTLDSHNDHDRVLALVPLLNNGKIDEIDRAWVQAHLNECPACREEAHVNEQMFAVLAEPVDGFDTQAALSRAHARIDAQQGSIGFGLANVAHWLNQQFGGWWSPAQWGTAVASVALLGLVAFVGLNSDEGRYEVLSSDVVSSGDESMVVELVLAQPMHLDNLADHFSDLNASIESLADGQFRLRLVGAPTVSRFDALARRAQQLPGYVDLKLVNVAVTQESTQ